ncbi:PAS-domain containing protein [Marinobacterium sedimentorum]|uniref:PAS-domain containing protein n=1 Tax=Marinobacterium sedimentorum TaxID=2927804 RepID=UPI0020C71E5A|nr:PAS-domain containing protein [Marinobacterium sedimentorum]MCP8686717.1 PAS-domain containing protein [Marinobacterium sedimentorum]
MHSARARLLVAFACITLAALALAIVGWRGLSDTEQSLERLREEILPDISHSLELAERTASLASLAPFVAEASAPFQLQHDRQQLLERVQQLKELAGRIRHLTSAPVLRSLLEKLYATLDELIFLTQQELFQREDLRQLLYQLQPLGNPAHDAALQAQDQSQAIDQLIAAASASSRELSLIQQRFNARIADDDPIRASARQIFGLRHQQLEVKQRQAYLLAAVRAISDQLSTEVKAFVDSLQTRFEHQHAALAATIDQGKVRILWISLVALLALVAGATLVLTMTHNLKAVTRLMTRLASGVTEQATPAVQRRDEIGSLARAFNVFRENSRELQSMAENLQKQQRLLQTVFDNINDGLSVFDRDQRLIAWNPRYLSIFDLPAGKIRSGLSLNHVQNLMTRNAHSNRTLDNRPLDMTQTNLQRPEQPIRFERYYQDGRVIEFRSQPMPDGGFVTLYSDLTDRKTIESQLRQAQKMEVLGQLTGGISHDFNNLLAAVIGNLQLLEQQPGLAEKVSRYGQRALAAAERGASLVQRLLAFSRKQQLHPEAQQLNVLIEGMLDLVEYSVGPHIDIQTRLEATDDWIYVDPGQLENALLNLALNSSAAMPDGGTLSFSTRVLQDTAGTDRVQIDVCDTGNGIPEELQDRVFDPFFTTKEVGQGSGLGLSMVYGFVKQSGGDIHIESPPGKGTCIAISLPRHQGARPSESQPLEQPLTLGNGELILLVEDDHLVLQAVEDMLAELGYEPLSCRSAEEALQWLQDNPLPDLVLSDINLGSGQTGIQLQQRLQQRWPQLPCVLASGLPRDQLSKRYGLPADAGFIAKPYRLDTLARTVATGLHP